MEFAKIFAVGKSQVLVTTDWDEDDKETPYKLNQRTDFKSGLCAQVAFKFKAKKPFEKAFNEYGQDSADKFYNAVKDYA